MLHVCMKRRLRLMRFLSLVKNELFYGGLNKEEFHQVKAPVGEMNRKLLVALSIAASLFWVASMLIYREPEYAHCMIVFQIALLVSILTLVCGLFLVDRFPWLLLLGMHLFDIIVLGTGFGLSLLQPDQRIATLIALVIIVPIFFIDRTVNVAVLEAAAIIIYAVVGKGILFPDVFSWGVKTLTIFAVAGIAVGHIVNKARYEKYLYADSAEKLADLQKTYNEELEREVEAKTEQIVALHDQFVIGTATMVESRDNSTGGHIKRTSEGVRLLTEEMSADDSLQLPDGFFENVIKAAPMHDFGKIAIDDAILRKPGRFTPEEFEVMKTHAAEGARIVHEILSDAGDEEFRRIAENVAHYHHERVDGSGYPDQLKGDEIPLEARIMAIADVYDALVSKRVYKESFSFEKANQIILEGMGTQFDSGLRGYYEAARPKLEVFYSQNKVMGD